MINRIKKECEIDYDNMKLTSLDKGDIEYLRKWRNDM